MISSSIMNGLRRFFSTGSAARLNDETAGMIEQSLKDTSELFKSQLNKTRALRAELQYLYQIFLRRSKYSYKLEFSAGPHFLLFATGKDAGGTHIFVYIPIERVEIAQVYVFPVNNDLVVDTLKLDFPFCDQRFGQLLLQELIAEARAAKLHRIVVRPGPPTAADFDRIARFCREAGFDVQLIADGEGWEIVYEIEP